MTTRRCADDCLRRGFVVFNRLMIVLWRLGLGPWINAWPTVGGRIMVLQQIGRRSGLIRRTPLNYAIVDGAIYCVAGFGSMSSWYCNVLAHPAVEVWLPDGWWSGVAEEISDPSARLPLLRQVLIASGFATMLAGINPYTIDDRSLDLATSTYRLICIRRTAARTGSGGPSDLAWVWLLLTGVVFLWLLCRRRGSSWMHVAHDQEMCRKEVASGCLCRHPLVAYGGVH